ncbi:MAG: B12-binding domain-containing radical SAM protein [Phycisphaerales bacterium]|nr:B12-binding domain-containing radical SAM protein [Phycisphaerales bacterium]
MRIALVNPITRRSQGYHTVGTYIPQLGLQVLAELVPDGHTVDIIDEVFGPQHTEGLIDRNRYDLVGVTGYSSGATRAYEIAAMCRQRGIRSIMGGPHASACPDEAARSFDSVAVGECDDIWPQIVRDAAADRLQPRYDGTLSNLEERGFGRARQGLSPINGSYDVSAIQTSRGCPVGCEYCSVTTFNGPQIRRRRISDIIDEWNATTKKFIFVVDDNFFGVGPKHAEWAKELLRALIKHGRRRLWFSQTTINMGDDAEGLRLAYQAGCRGMLVGFETFNPAALKQYHKGINRNNLHRYQELVNGFHRAGISVFGGFIIGADEDTPETVAETAMQAVKLGVDIIQVTNLTPLPGTKMYDRFKATGRLLAMDYPEDWERYTFTETIYKPAQMTARELDEAIYELRYAAAKQNWVLKRALRSLVRTRSLTTALFVLGMNRGWKRMARVQAPVDAERYGLAPRRSPRLEKVFDAFRMHLRVGLRVPASAPEPAG